MFQVPLLFVVAIFPFLGHQRYVPREAAAEVVFQKHVRSKLIDYRIEKRPFRKRGNAAGQFWLVRFNHAGEQDRAQIPVFYGIAFDPPHYEPKFLDVMELHDGKVLLLLAQSVHCRLLTIDRLKKDKVGSLNLSELLWAGTGIGETPGSAYIAPESTATMLTIVFSPNTPLEVVREYEWAGEAWKARDGFRLSR